MKNSPLTNGNGKQEYDPIIHVVNTSSDNKLSGILFITSYPPRECGIATYSKDLIKALDHKFNQSFEIKVCALESDDETYDYSDEVKYILNVDHPELFTKLAKIINTDPGINSVVIQHEFGFFEKRKKDFIRLLALIKKPVITVFHTLLPDPNESLKTNVQKIARNSDCIVVMTNYSLQILVRDYKIPKDKITVIPHGTHLVAHPDKAALKERYQLTGKTVLSTFGLLSSGKSIETTLYALPAIIKKYPDTLFLIIGKTHPSIVKQEGEKYRTMLQEKVTELKIEEYVQFINYFLPLPVLLDYLQLTDVYLFTSIDPAQAVSGTFSYAISCGCPVVSTPIPHACEVLEDDAGIIIDFGNERQLSEAVIHLLANESLRKDISSNGLHRMASTAWENAAIAHAVLFERTSKNKILLQYNLPSINLEHIQKMTTNFGILQFSKINQPDIDSGYTLDDNARAMIAMCQHFEFTASEITLKYIELYLNFIRYCLQSDSFFLNYINEQREFTEQNYSTDLADANGRAIWALGYLISMNSLPKELVQKAEVIMCTSLIYADKISSPRAMAFTIKGLYYQCTKNASAQNILLIKKLANRLVEMYRYESDEEWLWFERYLTYANSTLCESLLCAWSATGNSLYRTIAKESFDFLLKETFKKTGIKVIPNKQWRHKETPSLSESIGGEQPIDVAYTILALGKFYDVFNDESYLTQMKTAFDWFLGKNHLNQIIYNPCTGGCYDGLEENYVNLNQGAESAVSYLMARLTIEKYIKTIEKQNVESNT
ncbi:glycosyltransferase [Fluviicola sp. SGL-29]|nr:glycosyltransferase [Fluviicola sp. SGL-29]